MSFFTFGVALDSPFCVPWYSVLWKKATHFENTSMYRFSFAINTCALLRRLTNELAHQLTYLPICFTMTTTMMLLHVLCSWISPIKWQTNAHNIPQSTMSGIVWKSCTVTYGPGYMALLKCVYGASLCPQASSSDLTSGCLLFNVFAPTCPPLPFLSPPPDSVTAFFLRANTIW